MTHGVRRPQEGDASNAVPELELPVSQKKAKGPAPAAPPSSSGAWERPAPSAPSPSPYGGELDLDDDVVDRDVIPIPVASAGAPRGRIELGATVAPDGRIVAGSHVKVAPRRFRRVLLANALVVAVVAAAACAALLRVAHRADGWSLTALAPVAFDGSSALWSGVTSLVALAAFIALALAGAFARPRSYGYVLASLGMLVVGVAMTTVTFSAGSDGAPEAPPDGALLVPWGVPIVPLGIALRVLWVAWDRCDEGRASERARGAFVAVLAAVLAFASVELMFGAGVARLF